MKNCTLCPRCCHANREILSGYCGVSDEITVARAAPHFWEEPCISGENGSGAIFFTGCNLGCVYCQNREISRGGVGVKISVARLREIYSELIAKGVHNINLVTPTHYADLLALSLEQPLPVPVIYNCGGYESAETLSLLQGKIDVYLPDMKYCSERLAETYSRAKDYPQTAKRAIRAMFEQTGGFVLNENGLLQSGVLIRHLMLPGQLDDTLDVIDFVSSFNDKVIFSLMSQFTPNESCPRELRRTVSREEYEAAIDYICLCGLKNVFIQDCSSARAQFTPDFDLTGCRF